ncbi:MAG TPA: sigma-70 family RNA polymerase sigma factor, partial [Myxococcota bacterium]|nr:sigma-70 family RNA polymerase sigma factor [Myxococcota bacterium]
MTAATATARSDADVHPDRAADVAALFRAHERALFGLAVRLTGCGADADEVVQETFVRALATPPARTDEPWAPWLVRVATNLALDVLRRRRRRRDASWLPSPLACNEGEAALELPAPPEHAADARYERLESTTFAFLLALEALTPRQRATLVLRDVCGYSASETAAALGISEANVRVQHHRARRALAAYDHAPCRPDAALAARTRDALEAFVARLVANDVRGLEALLREDVRTTTDAGGEFNALKGVRTGRTGVLRFHLRVAQRRGAPARIVPCTLNGLPALAITFASAGARQAPRVLLRCDVDAEGRIAA